MWVNQGKKAPSIRAKAQELVRYIPQKDWVAEVRALWTYVKDRVRYTRDIHNVETLQSAERTLAIGEGDCDDKSVLLAAMLESIGHPTRFIAVGFKPGQFRHVLVQSLIGRKWVGLETTEPVKMGWMPPNIKSAMILHN